LGHSLWPNCHEHPRLHRRSACGKARPRVVGGARLADGNGGGGAGGGGRNPGPGDQGRGGAGGAAAGGAGEAESQLARRSHPGGHRPAQPRPVGDEPGSRQPGDLSAAEGGGPGVDPRPGTRGAADRAAAGDRLGAARKQRFSGGEPAECGGQPVYLPAGSGGLCQRAALGGDRVQTARGAGAGRFRRKPEPLQAAGSTALLVQRHVDRQQWHRQPRGLAHR
jgi:hypothetical protein